MVSPAKDLEVALWIRKHAVRRGLSHVLWPLLKNNMRTDTNEVLLNLSEMSQALGERASHISEALSELVSINAVERRKEGREVRWFVNPKVATHQSGAARDKAQSKAPELLTLMEGGSPSA